MEGFTNMVQKSVADKMATFDLVPESLHAYLQGRSTRDPISIMAAALDYANDTKAPLHCFLADIKACYDCIPFTTLQLAAARFGLPQQFLRLLRGMLSGQLRTIGISGMSREHRSPAFVLRGGIAQGCGLSCILLVLVTHAIDAFVQSPYLYMNQPPLSLTATPLPPPT